MKKTFKFPRKDWKTISIDTAKHILHLGNEYFEFTIEESALITKRAFSFLILLASILSVIIGYTFNRISSGIITDLDYLNIGYTIILSGLLVLLLILMFPKRLKVKGHLPRILAQEQFLHPPKLTPEQVYMAYVLNDIESAQTGIDFNLAKNKERLRLLKIVLWSLVILMPLYLVISFAILIF